MSQDPIMMREVNEGIDQHAAACTDIMLLPLTDENRTGAKVTNFRWLYRGGAYAFFKDVNMPDFPQKKWKTIVQGLDEKYIGFVRYCDACLMEVRKSGGWLRLPSGRYFRHHKQWYKGTLDYSPTQVANTPVQGGAAEIMKLAISIIKRRIAHIPEVRMINQVHDSIILDCPEKHVDKVVKICYDTFINLPDSIKHHITGKEFNVLLEGEVDVGPTWGEAKPYIKSKCGEPIYVQI